MKNPYEILGLDDSADEQALSERYELLKAKYSEDRFLPGEEGNEGARKLTELEQSWSQIKNDLNKKQAAENFGSDLGAIDDLIKKGNFDEAQAALDSFTARTAEWYYLQSIVYYKREWLSDSRKQLAIAVNMEPNNDKYKTALEKLDMVMGNPNADAKTIGVDPNSQNIPPQEAGNGGQMCGGNMLSNCCLAYCITDCCCSCTRCCG